MVDFRKPDAAYALGHGLPDAEAIDAAMHRSRGLSWPKVAAELGIGEGALLRIRKQWPVDEMAGNFALENARAGMLAMTAAFGESAQLLIDTVKGESADTSTVTLDQRVDAAKELIKQVLKAAEVSAELSKGTKRAGQLENMDDDALEKAARATQEYRDVIHDGGRE